MKYGSICRGIAYMPDDELIDPFTRARMFQVTSRGDEVRVIAYHGQSSVEAQRRPGGKGWEALALTQQPKGDLPLTGVLFTDIPQCAWSTLDLAVSVLRSRFGDHFTKRVALKVE
ncbi:hypothetical protein [Streptomyces sp. NPDC001137]|uniref:hypothetical protein n=1 Tax=Streptomyces sp. NPDC001137 TaxID=3154378 RepID=UPI00332A2E5D